MYCREQVDFASAHYEEAFASAHYEEAEEALFSIVHITA